MTKRARLVMLVLVVAAAGTTAAFLVPRSEPAPDRGPVIARVDGSPIYLADARSRVEGIVSIHGNVGEALGEDWPETILQTLVDDVIVRREAERRDIGPDDREIQANVDEVRADFPSDDAFATWLAEQGMDLLELERRVELNLLATKVYVAVTEDVTVTGTAIRTYYDRHRTDYDTGDRVVPLLEVRAEIRGSLRQRKEDEAYARWLEEQREAVDVSVVLDDWWRRA